MTIPENATDPRVREPLPVDVTVLIENYKIIADWIRFADAKAGVILGVQGVLASLLIPIATSFYEVNKQAGSVSKSWLYFVFLTYGLWFILFLLSTTLALRCVVPHRRKGIHPSFGRCDHFHPAAISSCYGAGDIEKFLRDYQAVGIEGLKREVLQGILLDSHISNLKYRYVYWSSHLFTIELIFGFSFYVLSRF